MTDSAQWTLRYATGAHDPPMLYGETLLSDVRFIVIRTRFGWGYTVWVDSSDTVNRRECISGVACESWEIEDAKAAALMDEEYRKRVNL